MSSSSPVEPRRVSIAIVDDDQSVRVSLRRLCEVLDMSATAYASGREFVASLDGGAPSPDCLLLDVQMPEMSGLELQRHLVATGRSIPTVAYTAGDAPEILANYIRGRHRLLSAQTGHRRRTGCRCAAGGDQPWSADGRRFVTDGSAALERP
jgi:CheY-like chemotaxis protein